MAPWREGVGAGKPVGNGVGVTVRKRAGFRNVQVSQGWTRPTRRDRPRRCSVEMRGLIGHALWLRRPPKACLLTSAKRGLAACFSEPRVALAERETPFRWRSNCSASPWRRALVWDGHRGRGRVRTAAARQAESRGSPGDDSAQTAALPSESLTGWDNQRQARHQHHTVQQQLECPRPQAYQDSLAGEGPATEGLAILYSNLVRTESSVRTLSVTRWLSGRRR